MRRIAPVFVLLAAVSVTEASAAGGPLRLEQLEPAAAPISQLRQTEIVRSLGVTFHRFRQEVDGVPVLGAEVVVTDLAGSRNDLFLDRSRPRLRRPGKPTVSVSAATASASQATGVENLRAPPRATLAILPDAKGGRLIWRVLLRSRSPLASFEVLVDTHTGEVVRIRDLLRRATGSASVYDPNPVTANGSRTGLADNNDQTSPLLDSLRVAVTLDRLSDISTCLRGQWVRATLGNADVCDPARDFSDLDRSENGFEAAMAYFHLDRVQAYIQSLGFTNVLSRQVRVHVNDFPGENSFYDPTTGEIATGRGGTDDAEDGDILVHEYGHAVQDDQVPGFGLGWQAGSMGEGFGDYLAAAIAANHAPSATFNPCIAEWDELGFGSADAIPCLRRADLDLTAAQVGPGTACAGEVHCAGQAWSGALWDIRAVLGGTKTDRLVIQSHFSLTSSASFHDGSRALLVADLALYGGAHQNFLRELLASRGFLDAERLDDDPGGATSLSVPGQISGSLSADDTHDVYALPLVAGQAFAARMTGGPGDFDLWLFRPGTASLNESEAIVAVSAIPGSSSEMMVYVPVQSGVHYLDVRATSGSGSYELQLAGDSDGDRLTDDRDNCPEAANAGQVDWDKDGFGDACDRSAKAILSRLAIRRTAVTLTGGMLPRALPARAWHVLVRRLACDKRGCRYRLVGEKATARRIAPGRVRMMIRLRRSGRYRFQVVLRAAGYEQARSRTLFASVG